MSEHQHEWRIAENHTDEAPPMYVLRCRCGAETHKYLTKPRKPPSANYNTPPTGSELDTRGTPL